MFLVNSPKIYLAIPHTKTEDKNYQNLFETLIKMIIYKVKRIIIILYILIKYLLLLSFTSFQFVPFIIIIFTEVNY